MRARNSGRRAFSPSQIDTIRLLYEQGRTQSELSRLYGVTIGTIGKIVRGETYQTNSSTGIVPPQMEFLDYDPNSPAFMKRETEKLQAFLDSRGIPYKTEDFKTEYTKTGVWPEGYTPTEEDIEWAIAEAEKKLAREQAGE